jgi:uncharacterized protein YodC (DUF2158 family)
MPFQPGDVVALKSGGQLMTVSGVSDEGLECVWLGEEGELFRETLPLAVLKSADGEEDEGASEADDDEEEEAEEEAARKIA